MMSNSKSSEAQKARNAENARHYKIGVMIALGFVLMVLASLVLAADTLQNRKDTIAGADDIIFTDEPCALGVITLPNGQKTSLKEDIKAQMKRARFVFQSEQAQQRGVKGKGIEGCYMPVDGGFVAVFEDGDILEIETETMVPVGQKQQSGTGV